MRELRVERLGQHGDGVAEGPVFVARALPGEVVTGDLDGARMPRPKIVTPSPARVSAPCPHYRACGGCALQHARDDLVARFKVDVVRAALDAQGIGAEVALAHVSPPESRRRAAFSGRRTKGAAIVGFHAPQSDVLTPVPECRVVTPGLRAALPALDEMTRAFGSRRGEMRFTVTETATGLDLDISGAPMPGREGLARAIEIAGGAGLARLTWEGEDIAVFVPPRVDLDGIAVPLPPGAFLQATAQAEAALRAEVTRGLADVTGPVVDLFAGIGTFALPLARRHAVHAVEGDAAAMRALDAGWRGAAGLHAVTTETRDLFRRPLLPDELGRFAAAVIDPPRAGAAAQVEALAASSIGRVVHVSCNPATFARDAATLIGAGFAIGPVAVVDQFRWSPHVELVAAFTR